MSKIFSAVCVILVCALAGPVSALGFTRLDHFPEAAPGAYGVVASGLSDGRFVVWNGDTVYVQSRAPVYLDGWTGEEHFRPIASGYAGDPGFIAVAPDGHTVLLGAGYSGKLYLLDTEYPEDYIPGSEVATVTHYTGVFLTQDLVLLDSLKGDYSTDELAIVDVSAPMPTAVGVMDKPPAGDLNPGGFAASAQVAVDASRTVLYTMSQVYDAGYMLVSNELKGVLVSDLLDAYNSKAVLDWHLDATAIGGDGAFYSGGPAGVMPSGSLVIAGFGGVQIVNPAAAAIVAEYAPAGTLEYYSVAYNPYADIVLPIVADPADLSMDVVYAPEGAFGTLPAVSAVGLFLLVGAVIIAAGRRVSR